MEELATSPLYLPHISPIGVDPVGGGVGDISLISPPYLPYRSGPCGWRSWRHLPYISPISPLQEWTLWVEELATSPYISPISPL